MFHPRRQHSFYHQHQISIMLMLFNRINYRCPKWLHRFPTFAWRVWGKPLASRWKIKLSIWLWRSHSVAPPHFNHESKTHLHHHFPVQWIDHAHHKTTNPDHNSIVFGLSGRCNTHCVITMDTTIHAKDNPIGLTHDIHSMHRHARLCTEAASGPLKQCCIFSNKTSLLILVSH